jgi:restriction system protein
MAIPDFQSLMLPLLNSIADGEEHHIQHSFGALADRFGLTEEERSELLPSGKEPTLNNRVRWAAFHMEKAHLLCKPRRGYLKITSRGLSVLDRSLSKIDLRHLRQYPEYASFRGTQREHNAANSPNIGSTPGTPAERLLEKQTPEEAIEAAYQSVRSSLTGELLQQIKYCSPEFFERLVVDLLVAMGYGGTRAEAGRAVGRSGDEGIDGIINEDRLGLDKIYIQAKRWENTVGRPDVQQFAGALQGQKARKGVFITTAGFSKQAVDYARDIESSVVLIDGETLAGLMIDYGVGTTVESSYEIKRIDSDYFDEA